MSEPVRPINKSDPKPKYDYKIVRPNGPWVPSHQTDVSKTWARAREQLKQAQRRAGE
jgi:hypothetical protein